MTLICKKCGAEKSEEEFSVNRARSSGRSSLCKLCEKEKNRASYERNAAARREYANAYNAQHKQQKSNYNKQYRAEHRDELIKHSRAWRKNNKPNRSEASKERARIKAREAYHTDPDFRARCLAYAKQYRSTHTEAVKALNAAYRHKHKLKLREYTKNYYESWKGTAAAKEVWARARAKHKDKRHERAAKRWAELRDLGGQPTAAFKEQLRNWQDGCCIFCNVKLTKVEAQNYLKTQEELEHMIPVAAGGTWFPYNLFLACGSCNHSKQNKLAYKEWNSKSIMSSTTFISEAARDALMKLCEEHNAEILLSGAIKLGQVEIFVISTFWCSSRTSAFETVTTIREKFPYAILIFDWEVWQRSAAVLNVCLAKAGLANRNFARELTLEIPTAAEAREFMTKWHLQGFLGGQWYFGLRNESDWLGMISLQQHAAHHELARVAFKGHIPGGLSKLIAASKKITPPAPILSYCDYRFGQGKGYEATGFTRQGETSGSYYYVNGTGMYNRLSYTKMEMAQKLDWFSVDLSERENAAINGLFHVEGLSQGKFILGP